MQIISLMQKNLKKLTVLRMLRVLIVLGKNIKKSNIDFFLCTIIYWLKYFYNKLIDIKWKHKYQLINFKDTYLLLIKVFCLFCCIWKFIHVFFLKNGWWKCKAEKWWWQRMMLMIMNFLFLCVKNYSLFLKYIILL